VDFHHLLLAGFTGALSYSFMNAHINLQGPAGKKCAPGSDIGARLRWNGA